MRKIKVMMMAMVIATAGFASEGATNKIDKMSEISEIQNFFRQNQVYSVNERDLQQISDEKLDNLYQETHNIKLNGFHTAFKDDQLNEMADLLREASLNSDSYELLAHYGMVKEPSSR